MTRKRTPVLPKKTMLIVTANEALAAYFSRARKDCRYANLTVQLVKTDSLDSLVLEARKLRIAGKFSSTWAVFGFADFDLKAEDVKAEMPLAEERKVKLGYLNPNLSMWLFLHLKALNSYVSTTSSFDQALSKIFAGYELTAEYFSNEGQDIHLKLFSSFSTAVLNASSYNKVCEKVTGLPATNFPLMYEDIKDICGEADLSHNQKLLSK